MTSAQEIAKGGVELIPAMEPLLRKWPNDGPSLLAAIRLLEPIAAGTHVIVSVRCRSTGGNAMSEPVAWQYRWKIDDEWVNWRVSDVSQKSKYPIDSLEERPLYSADEIERLEMELAETKDQLARAEVFIEGQKLELTQEECDLDYYKGIIPVPDETV